MLHFDSLEISVVYNTEWDARMGWSRPQCRNGRYGYEETAFCIFYVVLTDAGRYGVQYLTYRGVVGMLLLLHDLLYILAGTCLPKNSRCTEQM